jgi:hypothetical protein
MKWNQLLDENQGQFPPRSNKGKIMAQFKKGVQLMLNPSL